MAPDPPGADAASGPAQGRARPARGRPPASGPTPSAERTAEALTLALGLSSQAGAWLWTWPDTELAGLIAMEREEAEAIADPLANLMRGNKFLKRYAGILVSHEDWMRLFAAIYVYGERVTPLVAQAGQLRASRATVRRAERDARKAERLSAQARPRERPTQRPADIGGNAPVDGSGVPLGPFPAHLFADR